MGRDMERSMPPADGDLYAKYFEKCHEPLENRDRVWKAVTRYSASLHSERLRPSWNSARGIAHSSISPRERQYALDRDHTVTQYAISTVRTFVQSCTDLSNLPAGYFDLVFASNLLEHLTLSEAGATLDQARSVLKPGGHIVLLQPNFTYAYRQYFDDVTHMQIFTHVSLADFLKLHGFSIHEVMAKFLPFSMRSTRIPTFPWLVALYLRSPIKPFAGQMLVVGRR